MLPNKFVILWNNEPIGCSDGYPFKTNNPNTVLFWDARHRAEYYIDVITMAGTSEIYSNMKVVEIQFRIMDK